MDITVPGELQIFYKFNIYIVLIINISNFYVRNEPCCT